MSIIEFVGFMILGAMAVAFVVWCILILIAAWFID